MVHDEAIAMGKLSRLRRTGSSEDERRERGFRAWKERAKESIGSAMDAQKGMIAYQAAARMRSDPEILARWRGYCGAEDDPSIDYEHPCVKIEYICCDIDRLTLAVEDGGRFVEETGCDRDTFFAYYDQSASEP